MKHTLDPVDIPFLDIDDAPGVTPAKRSCKSASPLGSAKVNNASRFEQNTNRAVKTLCAVLSDYRRVKNKKYSRKSGVHRSANMQDITPTYMIRVR